MLLNQYHHYIATLLEEYSKETNQNSILSKLLSVIFTILYRDYSIVLSFHLHSVESGQVSYALFLSYWFESTLQTLTAQNSTPNENTIISIISMLLEVSVELIEILLKEIKLSYAKSSSCMASSVQLKCIYEYTEEENVYTTKQGDSLFYLWIYILYLCKKKGFIHANDQYILPENEEYMIKESITDALVLFSQFLTRCFLRISNPCPLRFNLLSSSC